MYLCIVKTRKNLQKMKKILLSLLVAAAMGLTATSCTKEVYIESSGTRVAEVTVKYDDWEQDDPNVNYVYCTVDWDVLSEHVIYDGNVNVYVYEDGRQNPLPYVYPIPVDYDDGTTGVVGENLRFDMEEGRITLIMQDLDGYKPQISRSNTPNMVFRIVATAPVNYIIND